MEHFQLNIFSITQIYIDKRKSENGPINVCIQIKNCKKKYCKYVLEHCENTKLGAGVRIPSSPLPPFSPPNLPHPPQQTYDK